MREVDHIIRESLVNYALEHLNEPRSILTLQEMGKSDWETRIYSVQDEPAKVEKRYKSISFTEAARMFKRGEAAELSKDYNGRLILRGDGNYVLFSVGEKGYYVTEKSILFEDEILKTEEFVDMINAINGGR